MNAAIVIAVEQYSKAIDPVQYAAKDATEFAVVLAQQGFACDGRLLVNERATKTSLESTFRTTLKQLTANDTLILFYAGRGFADGAENYLTCYDTHRSDLLPTSIPLEWLFQQCTAAKCKLALFLDACHGNVFAKEDGRELNRQELAACVKSVGSCVCFTPGEEEQVSHVSPTWQQGIWTKLLIDAWAGRVPAALDGNRLTSASLQNYLQQAVPLTLRGVQPNAKQTPAMMSASDSDFMIVDLSAFFATKHAADLPPLNQVKDSILLAEASMSVNRLTGFGKAKGHFIPERHGNREQAFINELAAEDLTADVEQVRAALKNAFHFTRRELKTENQGDGGATISTPYFNYNINVFQDAADPGKVVWRRSVDAILSPEQVLSAEFETVFARVFNTVQLSLHEKLDLDELIDSIESLRNDAIQVHYQEDDNITSCTVTIQGHDAAINITGNTFSIVHRKMATPKGLLRSLWEIQTALASTHHVLALRFKGDVD